MLFVIGLTLATLLAHSYIMGTPAASTAGSESGSPTTGFSDDRISVTGSLSSQRLYLTVHVSGTDAISQL